MSDLAMRAAAHEYRVLQAQYREVQTELQRLRSAPTEKELLNALAKRANARAKDSRGWLPIRVRFAMAQEALDALDIIVDAGVRA